MPQQIYGPLVYAAWNKFISFGTWPSIPRRRRRVGTKRILQMYDRCVEKVGKDLCHFNRPWGPCPIDKVAFLLGTTSAQEADRGRQAITTESDTAIK